MVLFESLARNDFSERGTQAEALIAKETSIANREVSDEEHRVIAVQGIFVGIFSIINK